LPNLWTNKHEPNLKCLDHSFHEAEVFPESEHRRARLCFAGKAAHLLKNTNQLVPLDIRRTFEAPQQREQIALSLGHRITLHLSEPRNRDSSRRTRINRNDRFQAPTSRSLSAASRCAHPRFDVSAFAVKLLTTSGK
jgi:hypothetical protein